MKKETQDLIMGGLNAKVSLKKSGCLYCGGFKRVEICDKCGTRIQKVDAYPKLLYCMVCGRSGKIIERECPSC